MFQKDPYGGGGMCIPLLLPVGVSLPNWCMTILPQPVHMHFFPHQEVELISSPLDSKGFLWLALTTRMQK